MCPPAPISVTIARCSAAWPEARQTAPTPPSIDYMVFNTTRKPYDDKRVRQAANLCVNRGEMKELLAGLMEPAKGTVPPGHPWFGNPKFDIRYDVPAAQALMKEAGFSAQKPVKVKVQISASGSGQMQPLPMNEFVQQNLADVGIKIEFDVVEDQDVTFQIVNRPGRFTYILVTLLGVGPIYVDIERA